METGQVTFLSADWKYIKQECEETLIKFRGVLESPNTSYKDKLIAIGHVANCKKILNLPSILAPRN